MNMTPSSALARLSGQDSFSRVAGIAPAPLLPGEQEAEYATLAARIVAAAQPKDAIEDLLTRDVVDLSWEILRLRRFKAGLLRGAIGNGISVVMDGLGYDKRKGTGLPPSLPPTGPPEGKLPGKKWPPCSRGRN
jgi:hypothetical protein